MMKARPLNVILRWAKPVKGARPHTMSSFDRLRLSQDDSPVAALLDDMLAADLLDGH
jgi:hypothetical protein